MYTIRVGLSWDNHVKNIFLFHNGLLYVEVFCQNLEYTFEKHLQIHEEKLESLYSSKSSNVHIPSWQNVSRTNEIFIMFRYLETSQKKDQTFHCIFESYRKKRNKFWYLKSSNVLLRGWYVMKVHET